MKVTEYCPLPNSWVCSSSFIYIYNFWVDGNESLGFNELGRKEQSDILLYLVKP